MKSPDINMSRMKRNTVYILGTVTFCFWLGIIHFLFLQKPTSQNLSLVAEEKQRNKILEDKIDLLNEQLKEQMTSNSLLLKKLVILKEASQDYVDVRSVLDLLDNPKLDLAHLQREENKRRKKKNLLEKIEIAKHIEDSHSIWPNNIKHDNVDIMPDQRPLGPIEISENKEAIVASEESTIPAVVETIKEPSDETIEMEEKDVEELPIKPVIPLLLFSCNRVTVNRALDLLLAYRPSKKQFPIIVTQDCGHKETQSVIESYGDQIIYIQQPDLSDPVIPTKEKKFKGYFKIARHYGWALNKTFVEMGFEQVIVVEDDLEISPDFFEYFSATLPILKKDKSLWCVSGWNDNGKAGLIDENSPELLYRTDFFPGLGWMLTKELWSELMVKWPRSYWDDWMREPAQRKGRSCIRPEVSRTKTFGKIGVSNGLFYEKHLKFIVLNNKFVPFTVLDLSFLEKENYDSGWVKAVYQTPVVNLQDLKDRKVPHKAVRLTYHTREAYKRIAKALGIMDDFKSGVPRMAYRGIVSFMHNGIRVYLSPNTNWLGYDPKWA